MSPVVDGTAGDLPVRDVGQMRGGLMPTVPDTLHDTKPWKKNQVMKIKDPQRIFRFPRGHLEDHCLRLQEENSMLRQHARVQEQKLRRMCTRLMRLRQASPGSGGAKDREMEDTIEELEAHVSKLESQKEMLQNKLSLAKQHIVDLGGRTHCKICKGKSMEGEGGVRRAPQTAPPQCSSTLEDTRTEMEKLVTDGQQTRVAELELTVKALGETLKEREREMEGTVREMRRQQVDGHRITIRENVDLIHLQKQLSEKSIALRVSQEKFNALQQAYENQLQESQRSLRESQGALLEKVEELTEELKQERQRVLVLEGRLSTTAVSVQTQEKLQDRISDLEGERDLLKENYNTLLESTFSVQRIPNGQLCKDSGPYQQRGNGREQNCQMDIQRLEEMLKVEREERRKVEQQEANLRQEMDLLEKERKRESDHLQKEILQHREQVSSLQQQLDSVTEAFDMSVEDLSETLLQIKAFRLQQESRERLRFLSADGKVDNSSPDLENTQASLAEMVLELQKTRNLLLLEHRISEDLREELKTVTWKLKREREESGKRMAEKDKLLSKRALEINTLQTKLQDLAYRPINYKRTIPMQYIWSGGGQDVAEPTDDDMTFSQLRAGESLLEIHLKAATFTPVGLRAMGCICSQDAGSKDLVTFCTYTLLDFEVHSTPLASGCQPSYSFTSRYVLTASDVARLGGQGSGLHVELHQASGGVSFVTHGSGMMSLMPAIEKRGQCINGSVKIIGSVGEMIGVVDFWARLFPPADPLVTVVERKVDRTTMKQSSHVPISLGWQDNGHEQRIHDYGGGIPNELVVVLERCMSLSSRYPGLLPDAYLTYRLYDLPPHVSQTIHSSANPVFNDATSYLLAITTDVLHYLRSSSLWVYVIDDSDDQIPLAYLAKTPIPLRALATGREIRGDYVLRDPAGGPRGMVRVIIKWKYPFQPPPDELMGQGRGLETRERIMESREMMERQEDMEATQRPVAKPRIKPRPPPVKQKSSQDVQAELNTSRRAHKRSPDHHRAGKKHSSERSVCQSPDTRSSVSDSKPQVLLSEDQMSMDGEEEMIKDAAADGSDVLESSSSQSDIVVIPPKPKTRKGDKLTVEILSLTFEPSSRVALDESVQRVFVEYRLLGVPMETTETPMSLRKPAKGEQIYYNFTRVIYVDSSHSAPLRHYLYTMLEGTDPNQGRLKFTVVSEPMDDDEECVDVGQAFLNLQELLLTGNDVIERQIDVVSVDEEKNVIGNLKVSLEAARALTGIYREFHKKTQTRKEDKLEEEEQDEKKDDIQAIDYEDDF
ncbi:protein fantom [Thalassophryne amazonica]|uniref:protein fantom n=1 Tax=Thalassophryne amazonica TaxID=390379 RepID=UPI001471A119|nr:protein fantom [Thalassophryne amazonica]